GNTRSLFDVDDVRPTVNLDHIDLDGKRRQVPIPFRYQSPLELIAEKDQRDLKLFVERAAAMDDRQKARELQDKTLFRIGDVSRAGRTIRYYSCFVPSRATWVEISKKVDPVIGRPEPAGEEDEDEDTLMSGGIFLSSR